MELIRPIKQNVLVEINSAEEETTKCGIILNNARDHRERQPTNTGTVLAIGEDVTEVEVGDEIVFREATYWKNSKKINPDAIDDETIIIQQQDILIIIK